MDKEILPIRIDGDPILRVKCRIVTKEDDPVGKIKLMYNTLEFIKSGVGLAAPQTGYGLRMFIIGGSSAGAPKHETFVNPEILEFKGVVKLDTEGCLSVPGVFARVPRYSKIVIKYYDTDFKEYIKVFKNFDARVIQHEYDHLNGVEFYDKISPIEFAKVRRNIDSLRNGDIPDTGYETIQEHVQAS